MGLWQDCHYQAVGLTRTRGVFSINCVTKYQKRPGTRETNGALYRGSPGFYLDNIKGVRRCRPGLDFFEAEEEVPVDRECDKPKPASRMSRMGAVWAALDQSFRNGGDSPAWLYSSSSTPRALRLVLRNSIGKRRSIGTGLNRPLAQQSPTTALRWSEPS